MRFDQRFLGSVFSKPLLQAAERVLEDATVSPLHITDNGLDGTLTRRSSGDQERVFVTLTPGGVRMDCSCEAEGVCVHGVALMMQALATPEGVAPAARTASAPSSARLTLRYRLDDAGVWPPRLTLSLFEVRDSQEQPLALSLGWLTQHRTRLDDRDWRVLHRLREGDGGWENKSRHELKPVHLPTALDALLDTGRCFFAQAATPLQRGPTRNGVVAWHPRRNGQQALELHSGQTRAYAGVPGWYIDSDATLAGDLDCGCTPEALRWVERGILINGGEYAMFMQRHGEDFTRAHLPLPEDYPVMDVQSRMIPTLRFYSTRTHVVAQQSYRRPALIDAIRVSFRHEADAGEVEFLAEAPTQVQYLFERDVLYRFSRHRTQEQRWLDRLESTLQSLTPLEHLYQGVQFTDGVMPGDLCVTSLQEWQRLLLEQVPRWRKDGWDIHIAPQFRHYFVESRSWQVRLDKDGSRLALGVHATIEGVSHSMLPRLLAELAATPERFSADALNTGYDTVLSMGDDRRVLIPIAVVRGLLRHLVELFDQPRLDRQGRLLLPAAQSQRLQALAHDLGPHWRDPHQVLIPIAHTTGAPETAPLSGLNAELRDYQWAGVAWLEQLASRHLGGILADDMGLGKTLQTLTFLLIEKNRGRLSSPALVVAPTSVLHNWANEAARFTPHLRVEVVHGAQRTDAFAHSHDVDVFVTSYALAHRDLVHWQQIPLSFLMLDEAHMIKNSSTKMARALREFNAAHRFCLTGTPLENHLGELWSLFDFMMPGILGPEAQFKRLYRIPIEKKRDAPRARALLARVSPHLLRRKKSDVARELPAKTEVNVLVSMGEAQAKHYEALHALTRQDIRAMLAEENGGQQQIHVLDALLRLRQWCCDPRLLPDTSLHEAGSAKLDHLLDMLQALTEEGHRILVFSQFASMLKLVSTALHQIKLRHLMLTGATQDRQSLVERFQRGEAPVFLISLKAGGTGLNLTAADTVIHFDPWWNPATEAQATDRAYRIGQDKPVFVYKLICRDTIEENIIALQDRKRALQEAVTEQAVITGGGLSRDDVEFLLGSPEETSS